jgi:hypothetical protein
MIERPRQGDEKVAGVIQVREKKIVEDIGVVLDVDRDDGGSKSIALLADQCVTAIRGYPDNWVAARRQRIQGSNQRRRQRITVGVNEGNESACGYRGIGRVKSRLGRRGTIGFAIRVCTGQAFLRDMRLANSSWRCGVFHCVREVEAA